MRRAAGRLSSAVGVLGLCLAAGPGGATQDAPPLGFAFTNIARQAGLDAVTVFGGERANRYLLETTGCGVALFDYDNDGRLDIYVVNLRTELPPFYRKLGYVESGTVAFPHPDEATQPCHIIVMTKSLAE